MSKHGLFAVEFNTDVLGGITANSLPQETQVAREPKAGELYSRSAAIVGQSMRATWSTTSIATALGLAGQLGAAIGDLAAGLNFYQQKWEDEKRRTSGSAHRKMSMAAGLILPRSLSVEHGGNASITYEAIPVSADGSTHPLTITESVALPTPSSTDEKFTLGGFTIGAVALTKIRGFEWDFGLVEALEAADSDLYATDAGIAQIMPVWRIHGIDTEWVKAANIPLGGKVATHANTTVYLRKRSGTGFVADATAEHIKLNAAGLIYVDNIFEASGNERATCSLVMEMEYDGTNAIVEVDTTSAIT